MVVVMLAAALLGDLVEGVVHGREFGLDLGAAGDGAGGDEGVDRGGEGLGVGLGGVGAGAFGGGGGLDGEGALVEGGGLVAHLGVALGALVGVPDGGEDGVVFADGALHLVVVGVLALFPVLAVLAAVVGVVVLTAARDEAAGGEREDKRESVFHEPD